MCLDKELLIKYSARARLVQETYTKEAYTKEAYTKEAEGGGYMCVCRSARLVQVEGGGYMCVCRSKEVCVCWSNSPKAAVMIYT